MEPHKTISNVWKDHTLKKIFLDIIYQTQLRKCKQLRKPFVQQIDQCVNRGLIDAEIYRLVRQYIEGLPDALRRQIQHQGHYRGLNRSNKIIDFAKRYGPPKIERVLDIGCGDGSITKTLKEKLGLSSDQVHGCDIVAPLNGPPIGPSNGQPNGDFTFSLIDGSKLPYEAESFDVVYALMSLHHVRDLTGMLQEIKRVLRPNGVLIVREHDCVSQGLSDVLDIVHGFYSMVWCTPQEHTCFQDEYYGLYRTADDFDKIITTETSFTRVLGTNRHEGYPLFRYGDVINPMKHYWVVYVKSVAAHEKIKIA
jgi:ubiquinone/menaquinone biosynthesis C-methylase UbiE